VTQRLQLVLGDDLVHKQSRGKVHVDAAETLFIAIGPDVNRLKLRRVDLTTEHADELRATMKPYLDAGCDPDEAPVLPGIPVPLPSHPGQGKRREVPGTRSFFQEFRKFARATGIPGYDEGTRNSAGKVNYPRPTPVVAAAFLAALQERANAGDGAAAGYLEIGRQLGLGPDAERNNGASQAVRGILE
jgi:hypothetical protein